MARPREFDIDDALERAMHVFWAKGYQGSSLNDLLDAMGIARGSLYKAFKDKHSIYLQALDYYDRTAVQETVDMLLADDGGDGAGRIRAMFTYACEPVQKWDDRRGCFMCNAAVDQSPLDEDVRARVHAMNKRMEDALARAVAAIPAMAHLDAQERQDRARLLLTSYMGVRVMIKSGYPVKDIQNVIECIMKPIEG